MLILGPLHSTSFNIKNFYILLVCASLLAITIVLQVIIGFWVNSLMLLASATHMLADFLFLFSSAVVVKLSSRPQNISRTYGYARLEVLASFANGIILLVIASQILFSLLEINISSLMEIFHGEHKGELFESSNHMHGISNIDSNNTKSIVLLSLFMLFINFLVSFLIYYARRENLKTTKNTLLLESTFLHMINDTVAIAITLIGALIIMYTNYKDIDIIFSAILCLLILRLSYKIIKKSSSILLDFTPKHININDFKESLLKNLPECSNIFHIHIWSLNETEILANFSILTKENINLEELLSKIKQHIKERYNICHSFIEIKINNQNNCNITN